MKYYRIALKPTIDAGNLGWYRQNPNLNDYLLVSSARIEMDWHHKNDADEWLILSYQPGDIIELKSINLSFPIEQIYRGLALSPDAWLFL